MEAEAELAKDFVSYANALTAFSVLQGVGFIHLMAGGKDARTIAIAIKERILKVSGVWAGIYSSVVIVCFVCECFLRHYDGQPNYLLFYSMVPLLGRLGLILVAQWSYRLAFTHPIFKEQGTETSAAKELKGSNGD
jgi:hypothetical protein